MRGGTFRRLREHPTGVDAHPREGSFYRRVGRHLLSPVWAPTRTGWHVLLSVLAPIRAGVPSIARVDAHPRGAAHSVASVGAHPRYFGFALYLGRNS